MALHIDAPLLDKGKALAKVDQRDHIVDFRSAEFLLPLAAAIAPVLAAQGYIAPSGKAAYRVGVQQTEFPVAASVENHCRRRLAPLFGNRKIPGYPQAVALVKQGKQADEAGKALVGRLLLCR